MKIKYILLLGVLIFVAAYGWRLYPRAFAAYQHNKDCEKASAEASLQLADLEKELDEALNAYSEKYNCPKKGAYYDFCNQFIESGFSISKITAKKLAGSTSTTIAAYDTIDETHNITDADLIEIIFITEDNEILLNYLNSGNFAIDKIVVYPTDNAIIVTFVVGGEI